MKLHWTYCLVTITTLYSVFLSRFYFIPYCVPDYHMYYFFGTLNLPAKDGFSSLFLWLASFSARYHTFFQLITLLMLTLSLFILNYVFHKMLSNTSLLPRCLMLGLSFSAGCWYYIYGKTFYDFPFIAFTYAVCFYTLFKATTVRKKPFIYIVISALMAGFCLSWKPYAVFPLAGLIGLIIIYKPWRQQLKNIMQSYQYILVFSVSILGYLMGNYKLLTNQWLETVQGIKAYPAATDILVHLFHTDVKVWDHVAVPCFNEGVFSVITSVGILGLLGWFIPKKHYFIWGWVMLAAYVLFIQFFSPGYTWHGFPFSLFIIILFAFILIETQFITLSRQRMVYVLSTVFVLCQLVTNFGYNLPKQINAFNVTNTAVMHFKNQAAKINSNVLALLPKFNNQFNIVLTLQRDWFRKNSILHLLPAGDKKGWQKIMQYQATRKKLLVLDVFIEPYELLTLDYYIPIDSKNSVYFKKYDTFQIIIKKPVS
jgi:hypothetical protein